jgi:oligopeptide/dipeptide ABC transporter ATP-binding protein
MNPTTNAVLAASDLSRVYGSGGGRAGIRAVDGVSFYIRRGETLGLVGESGCGKSTTGRMAIGLDEPSGGSILFEGKEIVGLPAQEKRQLRRHLQIVFQNPLSVLDPRMMLGHQIREPLDINRIGSPGERDARVLEMLEAVSLPAEIARRYPHQVSGGQAQRVVIARALALSPTVIVCDEPVSALDASVQAKVVALLSELQERLGVSYLFISHDLRVVKKLCHRVSVMYLGQIVEEADTDALYAHQYHPYTRALLSAIPDLNVERLGRRMLLAGDPPSPSNPPPGCRFNTRCPFAQERCRAEAPALRTIEHGRTARCHFAEEIAKLQ